MTDSSICVKIETERCKSFQQLCYAIGRFGFIELTATLSEAYKSLRYQVK